jgi:hypothetical protein
MGMVTSVKWVMGVVLGLGLAWAIYAGIIRPITKPNPSTTQKAEQISNYNYNSRLSFGCIRIDKCNPVK